VRREGVRLLSVMSVLPRGLSNRLPDSLAEPERTANAPLCNPSKGCAVFHQGPLAALRSTRPRIHFFPSRAHRSDRPVACMQNPLSRGSFLIRSSKCGEHGRKQRTGDPKPHRAFSGRLRRGQVRFVRGDWMATASQSADMRASNAITVIRHDGRASKHWRRPSRLVSKEVAQSKRMQQ
jgi:hypothetical protein